MNEAATTVPRAPQEIKLTPSDEKRFWAKVNKEGPTQPHMETPCWVWTASKYRQGYGEFGVGSKVFKAHRIAWMRVNGAIPHDGSAHGICVCHICDNPSCVRVDHLFLGTNADNNRDMVEKGRGKPPCGEANGSRLYPERRPRGSRHPARLHPERMARGEANGRTKLTTKQVLSIRAVYSAGGIYQKDLAAHFGVSQSIVSKIVRLKLWAHI